MDRLTKASDIEGWYFCNSPKCVSVVSCGSCDFNHDMRNRLGTYEDTGLTPEDMMRMKLKIGDTVYSLYEDEDGDLIIEKLVVTEVSNKRFWCSEHEFTHDMIGNKIFLTIDEMVEKTESVVLGAFKYYGNFKNSKGKYYVPNWAVKAQKELFILKIREICMSKHLKEM